MPKISLATSLRQAGASPIKRARKEPLWKGPLLDGITYSMLCRFLVCRERFRLMAILGLKPAEGFNVRLEYGQMWHVCEEALAKSKTTKWAAGKEPWAQPLKDYCNELCKKLRGEQAQIDKWYNVCKVQFPIYVRFWKDQHDVKNRTPMLQEVAFRVPYLLPSGRVVHLRGKWDAVDLISSGKMAGVYVQENKSKSEIDHEMIQRQLTFDLQTMIYLVAFKTLQGYAKDGTDLDMDQALPKPQHWGNIVGIDKPLLGVRYNVVRRPLSGGKGSIVQHKATKNKPAETKEHYFERLSGIISDSPQDFFARWKVEITKGEIEKFENECLKPVLEQLCDWHTHIEECAKHNQSPFTRDGDGVSVHWRHPFGVYNVLDEGGVSDLDAYLSTGSMVGLQQVDRLFTEL